MKLYFSPGACSLAPHILLREAGAAFDLEQVDNKAKKTKSGADFWQINPKGYVPVLELDDGRRITEAPAVLQYIADQHPNSGFVPTCGSFERYRVLEWLNFISSELHKTFGSFFKANTPEEYKAIARENLSKRYAFWSSIWPGFSFCMARNSASRILICLWSPAGWIGSVST